jgi:hypothetical protein
MMRLKKWIWRLSLAGEERRSDLIYHVVFKREDARRSLASRLLGPSPDVSFNSIMALDPGGGGLHACGGT